MEWNGRLETRRPLACVGEMRLSSRSIYLLETEEFRLKRMNICAASGDFARF